MTTLTVVFDGESLRPEGPVDLVRNGRYRARLEPVESTNAAGESVWDVLEGVAGSVEAPADWASEHDHYLYGTRKRGATGASSGQSAEA